MESFQIKKETNKKVKIINRLFTHGGYSDFNTLRAYILKWCEEEFPLLNCEYADFNALVGDIKDNAKYPAALGFYIKTLDSLNFFHVLIEIDPELLCDEFNKVIMADTYIDSYIKGG